MRERNRKKTEEERDNVRQVMEERKDEKIQNALKGAVIL
jgi:hypothetical protein